MKVTRRDLLKGSLGGLGGALGLMATTRGLAQTISAACGITPAQTEGPFFPVAQQADQDSDLTRVRGKANPALGQVIYIQGQVTDQSCHPVEGAQIEIWQACESGRYNHPADTNPAALDPNFQYWGIVMTDAQGRYQFKTIIPGAYPADVDWIRPPHIHFKVERLGFHELTTQMYFAGNSYNASDKILQQIPSAQRDSVVIKFEPAPSGFDPGSLLGQFDLVVKKVV